jgi:rifampicin phosphotransferase
MDINRIIAFDQNASLEIVGGKGLNLISLTHAGLPVPPGFIISTAAYANFVRFNRLDEQLAAAFLNRAKDQPINPIAAGIRAVFEKGKFPPDLEQEIITTYRQLCRQVGRENLAVAVRSSATAEDLSGASFAGQQDTYLNQRGVQELLAAVQRCFGSLWSERAIDYRDRQGLDPLSPLLAVVVQQMVFAKAAGVVFTANPLSGDSNQIVIESVFGLGEALVSGLVTPDHFLVDKRTSKILSYTVSEKTIQITASESGTTELPVPRLKRRARSLSTRQVQELACLAHRIETVYHCPQDLEWCLADGHLYIVQARAITTLPPQAIHWDAPGEGKWLHGGGSFEMITEPISPLFETFLLPIFVEAITEMLAEIGLKDALPAVPYHVVNGFIYLHLQHHLRPWHLVGVVKDFALHLNSMKDQENEQAVYRTTVEALREPATCSLSGEEILARMKALGKAGMHYWLQIMKLVQVIYRQEKTFGDFYKRYVYQPGDPEIEIFLRGQKIKPWEAECTAFDLAQLALNTPALADALRVGHEAALEILQNDSGESEFASGLTAYLERYGHQLSSFDLSLPTLADDPRPVLSAILAFLNGKESPYLRQQRMQAECEQATTLALSRISPRNQQKFTRLLSTAQHAARTREDALFEVGLAWTPMYRCALELGRRLKQAGVLDQPGDIFWLNCAEIFAALSSPQSFVRQIAERKANNQAWSHVDAPYLLPANSRASFWWHWIFPTPELQRHPNAHTLIGLGVSPGKVTAVARVIHRLDEMEQLQMGEILVARTTTPAWTPLFARASGLVTDLGGPLAHGSIVAREVGIPAVMGTGTATHRIRSGQTVTIFGSEGKVIINEN